MTADQILVKSGEIHVGHSDEWIYTTLGSCVAFCVHDKALRVGGMVHYLLPSISYARPNANGNNALNFGDQAIPTLLKEFKALGSSRENLRCAIFGGCGNVKGATSLPNEDKSIGRLNFECAVAHARRYNLEIVKQKVLLDEGLRVKMHAGTGEILIALNRKAERRSKLILIGASTGGTEALRKVVSALPANCPPVLIVQHMPPEFTTAFSHSLNECGPLQVKEARSGEILASGNAYLAPGGKHIKVRQTSSKELFVSVSNDPPVNSFRPSVDYLFHSAVSIEGLAPFIRAALLTGMGDDGARGLLALKQKGAFTIAQDEETSAIFGMPKAAIESGATSLVCRVEQIASVLASSRN